MPDEPAPPVLNLHKTRLNEALQAAEWAAAQGALAGPILHLRQRGDAARVGASIFLIGLVIAVVAGLLFYLAGPYVKQYVDGTRSALDARLASINANIARLDVDRKALFDGSDATAGLAEALKGTAVAIPSGTDQHLWGSVVDGPTILLYGWGGAITRSTDNGASFAAVPSGTDQYLWGSVVDGPTILLYGRGNAILRSTDGGASFAAVPSGTVQDLWGSVVDGPTILLYGDGGVILRSTDGGGRFATVPSGTDQNLRGSVVDGQTILLHGGGGAILRSTDGGASFAVVPSGADQDLLGSVVDGPTILLYGGDPFGEGGPITRSTDGGASFAAVPSGADQYLLGSVVDGPTILLYGGGGALTRSTDGGASFASLPSGTGQELRGSVVDGQSILLYGEGGAIIRLSDDLSIRAAALLLPIGAAGDTALLTFLDDTLPSHIRSMPTVQSLRQSLLDIQTQRKVLHGVQDETEAELERMDKFPYSLLLLEKQREDFASFMTICRGTPDAAISPDAATPPTDATDPIAEDQMTLACLSGWKDQGQSETQSWWQTLAAQVPPGILLLFLLSTLAALYRYNLRLAGFHHSRADALELMAMGKTKEDIEQLTSIAAVLAADKVVFGKGDAATRQAIDLINAIKPTGG